MGVAYKWAWFYRIKKNPPFPSPRSAPEPLSRQTKSKYVSPCLNTNAKLEQKVVKRTDLFKMTMLTSLVLDFIVDTFVVVYKFAFGFSLFHLCNLLYSSIAMRLLN